jgi:hypothetical protein
VLPGLGDGVFNVRRHRFVAAFLNTEVPDPGAVAGSVAAPGRYCLVAAAVTNPARVRELRVSMRGLLMAGQRKLHFTTEKDARRRTLVRTAWPAWPVS